MDITIKGEYIKLDQLIKLTGIADSGAMAKAIILDGIVYVNNEIEQRRGRKLYKGDVVLIKVDEDVKVNLF